MNKILIFICILVATVFGRPRFPKAGRAGVCGYDSCPTPQPGKINVHLVPHSHDDVGWLKTVDQYYYGIKNDIQDVGIQYILDSIVQALPDNPERKFIYVETAYFWKWWQDQNDVTKSKVKELVANGQLEFVGGGWSMNDEAITHYQCIIDQFTWGLRKLNDTFGSCGRPKVGWQIDPFGHSKENAAIMAQLGFDGLLLARLDYQDKNNRMKSKTMEMIWEAEESLGEKADIFTSALFHEYATPDGGFCWDVLCRDDAIVDDPKVPEYNVPAKVDNFIKFAKTQSEAYSSNNIIMTFGEDFYFQQAHKNFKNIDKLIKHVNERQNEVNVFYSTPSCYLKSVRDANLTWSTKQDDFFPYAIDPHSYFTGYFTSRPTLKYFERVGNNVLQVCKQVAAISNNNSPDIDPLREAMGVMQHHDAITGTESPDVAFDYARLLDIGISKCANLTSQSIASLQKENNTLNLTPCPLLNISECSVSSDSDNFIVTVYNPLSRRRSHYVRVPVSVESYNVLDPNGKEIVNQVVPIPDNLVNIPGRKSKTTLELVFRAANLPPLGYRSYFISKTNSSQPTTRKSNPEKSSRGGIKIPFGNRDGVVTVDFNAEYYIGKDSPTESSSGAYIFVPDKSETVLLPEPNSTIYDGDILMEEHYIYNDWFTIVQRFYFEEILFEMDWIVGPVPIDDGLGKEVIIKYTTNLVNNGSVYTDSNGRQTLRRIKDYRPTWPLEVNEPVAGNYYPVTTDISINDGSSEVTIFTDRGQGGASLRDGEIELMLHRRLLHVVFNSALNEEAYGKGLVVRGSHWLLIGDVNDPAWRKEKRLFRQEKVLGSYILLADAGSLDAETWAREYQTEFSGVIGSLTDSVQILTLEPWKESSILLRLEHILDKTELGETVTINLENLFTTFELKSIRETTLGANQWLDEATRFEWQKEKNNKPSEGAKLDASKDLPEVTLNPKEIRTFVIEIEPKAM